jgi:hypothetical protein
MAMQSSHLLCRLLVERQGEALAGRALPEIGRAHAADWRRRFALRVRSAAVFAHLAMRPGSAALLLPMLRRFPDALTLGALLAGKAASTPSFAVRADAS